MWVTPLAILNRQSEVKGVGKAAFDTELSRSVRAPVILFHPIKVNAL